MTNRREGREGREREGERDRERASRAKPGIQLVYIYNHVSRIHMLRSVTFSEFPDACWSFLMIRHA